MGKDANERKRRMSLEGIEELLREIKTTLEEIKEGRGETSLQDLPDWITLPDHLRKTIIQVFKLKQATADDVSEETKRARAVESGYLNQLVIMDYLGKERRGRKAYFFIKK